VSHNACRPSCLTCQFKPHAEMPCRHAAVCRAFESSAGFCFLFYMCWPSHPIYMSKERSSISRRRKYMQKQSSVYVGCYIFIIRSCIHQPYTNGNQLNSSYRNFCQPSENAQLLSTPQPFFFCPEPSCHSRPQPLPRKTPRQSLRWQSPPSPQLLEME
jgi:hypothetical protein